MEEETAFLRQQVKALLNELRQIVLNFAGVNYARPIALINHPQSLLSGENCMMLT